MATKLDDPRDIQGAYESQFNKLNQAEKSSDKAYGHPKENKNKDSVDNVDDSAREARDEEQKQAGNDANWATKYDGTKQGNDSKQKAKNFTKKGGPYALVLTLVLGGAGILGLFGSSGFLLVNLAEKMVSKFNYQLASLEARHNKIVMSKLANTTNGVCGAKVSFRCKFSTFSDKEIEKFKKAGITPNIDKKTSILGRNKITSFEFEGKTIDARSFDLELKNNASFNTAMHKAYNMKFSSMWDKVFNNVSDKYKISKKAPFEDGDDHNKKLQEITKDGRSTTTDLKTTVCKDPANCSPDELEEIEKQKAIAANSTGIVDESASSSTKNNANEAARLIEENASNVGKDFGKVGTSFLKATGPLDMSCMVYGWMNTISITAKVVRSTQMIRYAMVFLTTADMIKAGTAKPADVAALGSILTQVVVDKKGNRSKTATESFGYRYAAFGDKGIDTKASSAVAGAGFGGKLQSSLNDILAPIGGTQGAHNTCHTLSNPWIQGASFVIGIAMLATGAGELKDVFQAGFYAAVGFAGPILAAMVGDIVGGNLIDDHTDSETSGNFITSGSGGLLSQVATQGSNAYLHPEQAVQYNGLQNQVLADYAEFDRQTHNPFDVSNPNTFMGSIVSQLTPYMYSGTTPMAFVGNIASIVSSSAKNIISPSTSAAGESYTECQDPAIRKLNIATDPFCNPIVGIPPQYLGADPIEIQDRLQAQGLVDDDGNPIGDGKIAGIDITYPEFIANCIDRKSPIGMSDPNDNSESIGSECFIDSQAKADAYIHGIDMRIDDIDSTDPGAATGTAATGVSSSPSTSSPGLRAVPDYCGTNYGANLPTTDHKRIVCSAWKLYGMQYQQTRPIQGTDFMNCYLSNWAGDCATKYPTTGCVGGPTDSTVTNCARSTDCSGLVLMAIRDAIGLDVISQDVTDTAAMGGNSHFQQLGSFDEAQPGDIALSPGHHTEVIVSVDIANKTYTTMGAHEWGSPAGPKTYTYGQQGLMPYKVVQ